MQNFSQKHQSLIFSAIAVVVVTAIALVSYHAHQHNVASKTTNPTTGAGVTGSSTKYSTATNTGGTSTTNNPQKTQQPASQAKPNAAQALYLMPASTTINRGATFTVQIRENSGGTSVNAVQANLSYPADKLKFVSINAGSSVFSIAAQGTGGSGQVAIARGSTSAITGDQNVATVTFTVLNTPGDATLTFANGSALVTANSHQNLLGALGSDVYHIQ